MHNLLKKSKYYRLSEGIFMLKVAYLGVNLFDTNQICITICRYITYVTRHLVRKYFCLILPSTIQKSFRLIQN